jgi:hypothetical protein
LPFRYRPGTSPLGSCSRRCSVAHCHEETQVVADHPSAALATCATASKLAVFSSIRLLQAVSAIKLMASAGRARGLHSRCQEADKLGGPQPFCCRACSCLQGLGTLAGHSEAGLGCFSVKRLIRIYRFCSAYGSRLSDRRSRPLCAVETGRAHKAAHRPCAPWWTRGESNPRPTHFSVELQKPPTVARPWPHTIISTSTAGDSS